ncbi:MAG: FtsX-like permease family protein [Marinoscillum sp.]
MNYTNLSTARSIYRAKEVGMRKVAGSTRGNLTIQFLIESLLITSMSFVLALILIQLGLPFFNEILEKSYSLWSLFSLEAISAAIGLILVTSLLAGLYPAIYISGVRPLKALSGKSLKSGGIPLRKVLIVFQFFTASAVILFTFLVMDQIRFMQNQNLGFNKEQVLIIDASNVPGATKKASFKNELKGIANVTNASFNNVLPGRPGWQGQWAYAEKVSEDHVTTEYMAIDEDYINTLNLQLIAGRNFELDRPSELEDGLIINETCVTAMGWNSPEEAIGKRIVSPSGTPEGKVIGVVKDYHGLGLQNPIWPKAMDYSSTSYGRYFAIQFGSGNTTELITQLEEKWTQLFPDYPMEYSFLDVDFDRQYKKEQQLVTLLGVFTVMIIVISSIGLLGLVSFVALSKTKEIGIRKTLGASIRQIILLLSKDFMILVLIGNVLAIPLIWYLGRSWLADFAYATSINPLMFVLTALVTLIVSFATVGLQTLKTARMNPSRALRYE